VVLKVVRVEAPRIPRDESDHYIPLSVDWFPEYIAAGPVYCFIRDRKEPKKGT
jgi:hypothetical protein